jgi:hypothetical protein
MLLSAVVNVPRPYPSLEENVIGLFISKEAAEEFRNDVNDAAERSGYSGSTDVIPVEVDLREVV